MDMMGKIEIDCKNLIKSIDEKIEELDKKSQEDILMEKEKTNDLKEKVEGLKKDREMLMQNIINLDQNVQKMNLTNGKLSDDMNNIIQWTCKTQEEMKKEKQLVRIEEEQKRMQIINGANYDIQNLVNATAVQLKGVYMTMEILKNELINQKIQINMINDRDRYELKLIDYIIN